MEGPSVVRIVDPAGEAIGVIADGRVQVIGIGARKGAPVRGGIEEIQRLGGEGGAAVAGVIVVEVEAEVVGSVQGEVRGPELAYRVPGVIIGEAGGKSRGHRGDR